MSAGELRERVTFAKRETVDDGYGNVVGDFVDQFSTWARVTPMRGGETVMAARLAGRQPVAIKVRYTAETMAIAPDWRAKNAVTGEEYAVHSIANMDERRAYLTIMAEAGVAA